MINLTTISAAFCLCVLVYGLYQRRFHPLSSFPGPFLASVTNFWRFHHELRGDLPSAIDACHTQYGPFVRVAPNEINTVAPDVVDVVYTKGGRHYLKSDFYNGFTAIRPNIFGTRDESHHSLRRRQMAHAFSQASLVRMEYIFDRHTVALVEKLGHRCGDGASFNLTDVLKFFSQDCNGDLSLGVQFKTQEKDDPSLVPPLNDHIALAKLTGYVPWVRTWFNILGPYIPWPYLQQLLRSRAWMRQEAARVTELEFKRVGRDDLVDTTNITEDDEPDRVNLFTSLVRGRDPDTDALIERDDVISNAITFLTAGSHSTAATLEICWWFLCRYPEVQRRAQAEIEDAFGPVGADTEMLPYLGLEAKLPYTSAMLKECFRLAPTFQHPAPRVTPDRADLRFPTRMSGVLIPPGFSISASVFSLHRNVEIWGEDACEYIPERWLQQGSREREKFLMHFGAGHRSCIGRNQSLLMIWKATVETLRRFNVAFADVKEPQNKEPELHVCGFAELAAPLVVKLSKR